MNLYIKWIPLFFCLCLFGPLKAQMPYEIHWGKIQESEQDFLSKSILKADTNGILLLRQEIEEHYQIFGTTSYAEGKKLPPVLEHYTPDMKRNYSFELKGWSQDKDDALIKAGVTEGHYDRWYFPFSANKKEWLAYSNYNQKEKYTYLYAREIDLQNQGLAGAPIELFRLKDTIIGSNSRRGDIQLQCILDQAGSKMMFFTFPEYTYPNRFNVKILDRKMRPLWSKDYDLPFDPNTFEIREFCLSVTGKFYCLARIYEPLPEKGSSPVNYTYSSIKEYAKFATILLEFSSESNNANFYRLDMGDNDLIDADMLEDKEGQIHCVGTYTADKYTHVHGCVDFVLNPFEQMVSIKGPLPFPQSLLQKVSLEKNTLKNPFLESFNIGNVGLDKKGATWISGSYGDFKGSYHGLFFQIDSTFKDMQGTRIKKSQLIKKPSDWIFAGASTTSDIEGRAIAFFNDNIQGDNSINIYEWSKDSAEQVYKMPYPDQNSRMLMVTRSTYMTSEDRLYFIGEARNHKSYQLGYIQRKK